MNTYEDAMEAQMLDESMGPITDEEQFSDVAEQRKIDTLYAICDHTWIQVEWFEPASVFSRGMPVDVFECRSCGLTLEVGDASSRVTL